MPRAAKSATSRAQLLRGKEALPSGVTPHPLGQCTETEQRVATLTRSSSPLGRLHSTPSAALSPGASNSIPGTQGLVLLLTAPQQRSVWPSREAPEEEGSCGSWGSCHQHSKAPIVGQHNQQKLAQSVLPTILRDSTPAGQHMEEASVLVPEELLYFL